MLRFLIAPVALWFAMVSTATAAEPRNVVRVRVWDERQPEQKKAYDGGFLGDSIARHLRKNAGFEVKSVALDDPDQGLSDAALDQTDVLIWWGHVRHDAVKDDRVKAVVDRVMAGKLSLIALHSAHFARPFMSLMHERSKADALKMIPEADRRAGKFDFSRPLKREMVKPDSLLTPRLEKQGETWMLIPPVCVFPSWRADAAPGHVTTLLPDHPIAAGLPKTWDVRQTEMYSEPFHVPAPDAVIFEEKWDKGERFRSGCLWTVGKGKVFYFRPGHETYPVFEQAEVIHVLENAVKFMAMK